MIDVLVPMDTSAGRARVQAQTLVELAVENVHAILFHVFTDNPQAASVTQLKSVRRAKEHLTENGIDVTLTSSSGDPVEEILVRAEERDVDMICVAGRKRTPVGKLLFGSVSRSVLLEANRPVLFCTEPDESAHSTR